MEVIISKYLGFCFGVKDAIDLVEKCIKKYSDKKIYTFGEIIHNKSMINNFRKKGVNPINSLEKLSKGNVLIIRAHGVPPRIYAEAREKDIIIEDATCSKVNFTQKKGEYFTKEGYTTLIIGNKKHPEVIGLKGFANSDLVIDSLIQAKQLPQYKKLGVIVQTTFTQLKFLEIIEELKNHTNEIKIKNTICNATKKQQDAINDLETMVNVIIVVGGKNSSNTRKLYERCQRNKLSYLVESEEEVNPLWFKYYQSVGVTAGASTPDYLIQEVVNKLKKINPPERRF
ncbi:4-hydroxy-3-methylbut-2-enyl diphosphate reductase [archaeon]|jgi:4-hydroxy-3-methylbut-2-en-1-yl diphosphate reductase|nr:4-hydroxy-3-methylbut-2-enyl diphosphate reductase [archaeon]